jgi:hypothetical protein
VSTASSYLSASDKRIYFGLGKSRLVKRLEIAWPSGKQQVRQEIKANQMIVMREPVE